MIKKVIKYGEAEVARAIRYVDESAQTTGNKNKWKDWNLVVRKCIREGWGKNGKKSIAEKVVVPVSQANEKERILELMKDV